MRKGWKESKSSNDFEVCYFRLNEICLVVNREGRKFRWFVKHIKNNEKNNQNYDLISMGADTLEMAQVNAEMHAKDYLKRNLFWLESIFYGC